MRVVILAAAAALTALTSMSATPAFAQIESREGIALENEILELRQQLQQLQQLQVQASPTPLPAPVPQGDNEAPPQPAAAPNDMVPQLVVRVSALEEQMRALQGRVEELSNQQQRDHDDLTKQIGDLAFKLNAGAAPAPGQLGQLGQPTPDNGGVQSVPANLAPASGSTAPALTVATPPPAHRKPEQALKMGNAALARRDYDAAASAAQEVLADGQGPRTGDAQFLLARASAGKHDYKAAAASYYMVYKSSPKTPRGAESLIGVANAFLGLGDKPHACQVAAKFGAEFPHPDNALRGAASSVKKRGGC